MPFPRNIFILFCVVVFFLCSIFHSFCINDIVLCAPDLVVVNGKYLFMWRRQETREIYSSGLTKTIYFIYSVYGFYIILSIFFLFHSRYMWMGSTLYLVYDFVSGFCFFFLFLHRMNEWILFIPEKVTFVWPNLIVTTYTVATNRWQ